MKITYLFLLAAIAAVFTTLPCARAQDVNGVWYWSLNACEVSSDFSYAGVEPDPENPDAPWNYGNWNPYNVDAYGFGAPDPATPFRMYAYRCSPLMLIHDSYTISALPESGENVLGIAAMRFVGDWNYRQDYSGPTLITGNTAATITLQGATGHDGQVILFGDNVAELHFEIPVVIQSTKNYLPSEVAGAMIRWNSQKSLTFDKLTLATALDGSGGSSVNIAPHGAASQPGFIYIKELVGVSDSMLITGGNMTQEMGAEVSIGDTSNFLGTIQIRGGLLRLTADLNDNAKIFWGGGNINSGGGQIMLAPGVNLSHTIDLSIDAGWGSKRVLGIEESGTATFSSTIKGDGTSNFHIASLLTDSTFIFSGEITSWDATWASGSMRLYGDGNIVFNNASAIPRCGEGVMLIGAYDKRDAGNTAWIITPGGTTTVGGTGQINMPAALFAQGGLTNAYGAIAFNGGLDFSAVDGEVGQLQYTLGDGFGAITASAITGLTLNGNHFSFTLTDGFDPEVVYSLITTTGGITGTVNPAWFALPGGLYEGQLEILDNNLVLNIVAVPEPASLALLGMSLLVVTVLRRRK